LDAADIRERKDYLALLTPEAFHYYLPAYLLACIDARAEVDSAWDAVIFRLTPPKRSEAFFSKRAEMVSSNQAHSILGFLELQYEVEKSAWLPGAPPEDFSGAIRFWRERSTR
jgi:hypothetical protein